MSDYYTESQMQRIEQAAYDGATLEAGKEWERQRYEFDATEAKLVARIAELEAENDRLQSGWFRDETICPDGSLRPKVSDLLNRIAELEAEVTKHHELQDSYCDRIAELEAAQRWIPVSERLPEDEKTVFVVINDVLEHTNEVARLTYLGNGNWWSWKSERYIVTHWMPLPESPIVYGKVCEE